MVHMDDTCKRGHLWSENERQGSSRGRPARYCAACRAEHDRKRHIVARLAALDAYGGACVYCGVTHPEWLAFDHVNDDGHVDRVSGSHWVRKLRQQGYPDTIQLLCHNCNSTKASHGEAVARKLGLAPR